MTEQFTADMILSQLVLLLKAIKYANFKAIDTDIQNLIMFANDSPQEIDTTTEILTDLIKSISQTPDNQERESKTNA